MLNDEERTPHRARVVREIGHDAAGVGWAQVRLERFEGGAWAADPDVHVSARLDVHASAADALAAATGAFAYHFGQTVASVGAVFVDGPGAQS